MKICKTKPMELNTIICKDGGILKELYKSQKFGQVSMWVTRGEALFRLAFSDGKRETLSIKGSAPLVIKMLNVTRLEIANCGSEDIVLICKRTI